MAEREPISKRTRFDVFKRDRFTCQYCGSAPPRVVLEIDHVIPVCEGGRSLVDNLVTSCFECNRGKGGISLKVAPETIEEKRRLLAEKQEQIKAFERLVGAERKALAEAVDEVQRRFQEVFPTWVFMDKFRRSIERNFLTKLSPTEVADCMDIAIGKCHGGGDRVIKYFCGVCWGKIRELGPR